MEVKRINLVGISNVQPMLNADGSPLKVRGFIGEVISHYEDLTDEQAKQRVAELNAQHRTNDFTATVIPQSSYPALYR